MALAMFAACANNVSQDKRTGPDGRAKGAMPIPLVNNEARATGIVTYPGGDRVDWKIIELPAQATGRLDVKLTWEVPRPGLRLGLDVFDAYYKPVGADRQPNRRVRLREASVPNAAGKYFVRVYAERRGDAGRCKLVASLTPEAVPEPDDDYVLGLQVADPPPLEPLPEVVAPCTEDTFDMKRKECKDFCPEQRSRAARDWKACSTQCDLANPDVELKVCQDVMPCPATPDRRVKKCPIDRWKACDWSAPDSGNPKCDVRPPVIARVQKNAVGPTGLEITLPAGVAQGITKSWTGVVLMGMEGDRALTNGAVKLLRVDTNSCVGVVQLTPDQVKNNPRVKLSAPPR